jgi:flagellar basal-body rod protein FlgB
MSINSINTFSFTNLLAQQARSLSYRHEVLSNNIANLTTPGYKASEVALASNFKELLGYQGHKKGKLQLFSTSYLHLQHNQTTSNDARLVAQTDVEEKPNGNNVSSTGEFLRLAQNQSKYDAVLSMFSNYKVLNKTVLDKE